MGEHTWKSVKSELLSRIANRAWKAESIIPSELQLAKEFGCSRVTVNRAVQDLVEAGLLARKRRAGTRVISHPVRHMKMNLQLIRKDIESMGSVYQYSLIECKEELPTESIHTRLQLPSDKTMLHLRALHFGDAQPFVYEDRWINIDLLPAAKKIEFKNISANEWLLENAPFTRGAVVFKAVNADTKSAELLDAQKNDALFVVDRMTYMESTPITYARMMYRPGYVFYTTV